MNIWGNEYDFPSWIRGGVSGWTTCTKEIMGTRDDVVITTIDVAIIYAMLVSATMDTRIRVRALGWTNWSEEMLGV